MRLFSDRAEARTFIGAAGLFIGLTVLMTWPMVVHPFARVPGPPGDNLYFLWLTDWYYRAVVELRQWPVYVAGLNAPAGWSLAYNEMTPAMALLGLPAVALAGPAAGYNFAIFLSFVLTAVFTFLWVRSLTGSTAAALLAGTSFAFAPYRLARTFGHFNLLGTQWLPLYFWSVTALVIGPGRSLAPALGVAASIILIAATSQYYLYMTALISVPYVLVLLRARPAWYRDAVLLRRIGVALVAAVPGILFVIWPHLELARAGLMPQRSLAEARVWFASPTDFLLPTAVHAIVGDWAARHFDQSRLVETMLQLSVVALALASVAVWRLRGDSKAAPVRALAWCAASAFVLSLGMELHWLGRVVIVPVPAPLQGWTGAAATTVPLPSRALFEWLPYYANMRAWTRWGVFVALFVSVLAGGGFAHITRGWRPARVAALLAVLLAIIVLEYRPRAYMMTDVAPRPVDTWLATQPKGLVVQIPAVQMALPQHTFYTRYHGQPFAGAFFSAFQSPEFKELYASLEGFPDERSMAALRARDVRWVVVDLAAIPDPAALRLGVERLGLRARAELAGQAVFALE